MKIFSPKINSQKGYTLLFAVIVSVLVLSIAAFILSVSRKEAILASASRDSIYAFYAADSGLECAVEHLDTLATSSYPSSTFSCGGNTITFSPPSRPVCDINGIDSCSGTSTFSMPNGSSTVTSLNQNQSGVASCASTSVAYTRVTGAATSSTITVTVRGYNIGYENIAGVIDCNVPGPRKVERALQYTKQE